MEEVEGWSLQNEVPGDFSHWERHLCVAVVLTVAIQSSQVLCPFVQLLPFVHSEFSNPYLSLIG